jgi:hypothetical protein
MKEKQSWDYGGYLKFESDDHPFVGCVRPAGSDLNESPEELYFGLDKDDVVYISPKVFGEQAQPSILALALQEHPPFLGNAKKNMVLMPMLWLALKITDPKEREEFVKLEKNIKESFKFSIHLLRSDGNSVCESWT